MNRYGTVALIAIALTVAACSTGSSSDPSVTPRPPLEDPPDPGPAPGEHGLSSTEVARLAESTVRVVGIACGRTTEGSGFAVSRDVIVTNAHVVFGVDEPMIEIGSGERFDASVEAFDAVNDLALLRVSGAQFEPLALGDASDGTVGALFGWEQGPELQVTPFRIDRPVTVRIEAIGSEDRIGRPSYLLAADIEAGDSGAALVDETGTVVGIAYMSTTRDASVGYAVRTDPLADLIEQGFSHNAVVPECGVTTQSGERAEDGS